MNLEDIYSFPFTKYFKVDFREDLKSTVNLYHLITDIYTITGSRPKKITSENRRSFTIEVTNENQSDKIFELKKVNDIPCVTTIHPRFNFARGIIYIQEDLDEFKTELQSQYSISDVTRADLIKTRNPDTKAYIVTFKKEHLPYSIYIHGERQDTRVYKFHNKLLVCNQCLSYGHPRKWCKGTSPISKKLSAAGHSREECQAERPFCFHCHGEHEAGNSLCPRQEKEILLVNIQESEKVGIQRARQIA